MGKLTSLMTVSSSAAWYERFRLLDDVSFSRKRDLSCCKGAGALRRDVGIAATPSSL